MALWVYGKLEETKDFLVNREHDTARKHQSAQPHRAASPEGAHSSILPRPPDGDKQSLSLTALRASLHRVKGLSGLHRNAACNCAHCKRLQRAFGCVAHAACVLSPEGIVRAHSHG